MSSSRIYIFLCNQATRKEVLSKMLVGTTAQDWNRDFKHLKTGDYVLVYDYTADVWEFIGPFKIVEHKNGRPLDTSVWRGKYPAQARIEDVGTRKNIQLQEIIDLVGATSILRPSNMPFSCLDGNVAMKLREIFGFPTPYAPVTPTLSPIAPPQPPPTTSASPEAVAPRTHKDPPLYKTIQGFSVRSKAECAIANLLARWGIECHYERPIPGGVGYLCDFYLPAHDLYIEYWGLIGDSEYEKKRKVKTRVYNDNGLRLLELEPADEQNLESRLKQELRRLGIDVDPSDPKTRGAGWFARLLAMIKRWLGG